jgi:hypothetical protein
MNSALHVLHIYSLDFNLKEENLAINLLGDSIEEQVPHGSPL